MPHTSIQPGQSLHMGSPLYAVGFEFTDDPYPAGTISD